MQKPSPRMIIITLYSEHIATYMRCPYMHIVWNVCTNQDILPNEVWLYNYVFIDDQNSSSSYIVKHLEILYDKVIS